MIYKVWIPCPNFKNKNAILFFLIQISKDLLANFNIYKTWIHKNVAKGFTFNAMANE
jgi:hypothetical protein